ncbi:hypothetical protein [Kitasatospora sp. MMS16-BH015]|uniref:hypothetical protein n=1 Tax=Kitasatospora sp. MMS16-BH015 TaxID=2018025 RepID=UPI0020C5202A|nr:hypothetical protein [Kitasatospora sp. MMS16-BH015]
MTSTRKPFSPLTYESTWVRLSTLLAANTVVIVHGSAVVPEPVVGVWVRPAGEPVVWPNQPGATRLVPTLSAELQAVLDQNWEVPLYSTRHRPSIWVPILVTGLPLSMRPVVTTLTVTLSVRGWALVRVWVAV